MFNPFQNIVQMLSNPLNVTKTQNHHQSSLFSTNQLSQFNMPIWPVNPSIQNYSHQPYISYIPQQNFSSQEMNSILLLSNLLKKSQSQHFHSQILESTLSLNKESQSLLQSNSLCINKNESSIGKEIKSKKVIFNSTIKSNDNASTINNNTNQDLLAVILEDDSHKSKQLENKLRYYKCTFKDCDKVFPKECNLKDHIRTHTGEKPYQCSFGGCGKSFSQHGNLKKHEKVHIGDKKFFCDYPNCGKKFSASYNLKIHYRCHTGERPYKCSFKNCNRSFYDKGNLKYHEKTMHIVESITYPFSCEHMGCNAKFKSKNEKLNHHNEMEPDCLAERKELIKLIQRYKVLLKYIIKENNINESQNEVLINLKRVYEEIEGKLIDVEYFKQLLGENFDDDCSCMENIKDEEKETDQASSKNE